MCDLLLMLLLSLLGCIERSGPNGSLVEECHGMGVWRERDLEGRGDFGWL